MTKSRFTILIVDDDEEIVQLLKDFFEHKNCEVVATHDPAAVLDCLRNFRVKLMLLDLKLKCLDGFEILNRIKKEQLELPATIIITGYLPKYVDSLKAHGISTSDVLAKPFSFDEIERMINRKLKGEDCFVEEADEQEYKLFKKNRCRIAFVEDEADLCHIYEEVFRLRHFQVFSYRNGTDAFKALQKEPVDIVVVDIKLPGMQGDQLIEALSRLNHPPECVVVSADLDHPELVEKLKSLGCKKFIVKPIDIVELVDYVKSVAVQKKLLG